MFCFIIIIILLFLFRFRSFVVLLTIKLTEIIHEKNDNINEMNSQNKVSHLILIAEINKCAELYYYLKIKQNIQLRRVHWINLQNQNDCARFNSSVINQKSKDSLPLMYNTIEIPM